jgi:AraC-like DNA-binding protein
MNAYMDPGKGVEVVADSGGTVVMQARNGTGTGVMTLHEVLPGVIVVYNDFHMREIKSEFSARTDLLCIDHCREGRIEQKLRPGVFCYTGAGDLRIDTRQGHDVDFYFPLSHYHGITIGFDPTQADRSIRCVFPDFPISVADLRERFCSKSGRFFLRNEAAIEHIFSELYLVPEAIKKHYLQIKVFELLLWLGGIEFKDSAGEKPYFYKSQTEKAKAACALMSEDLSRHYTVEELAGRFDISTTALKSCFKAIFGSSVYSFLRSARMNRAATLLRTTDMSVAQVAGEVGYNNPSKFAAAFQNEMKMLPLEYRNAGELENPAGKDEVI